MKSYIIDGKEFSTLEEFAEHFSSRCLRALINGAETLMHSTTFSEAASALQKKGSDWCGSILTCLAKHWATPKHRASWNPASRVAIHPTEMQLPQSFKMQ
jgi:hypothetical protein